jgi:hypothetical protein
MKNYFTKTFFRFFFGFLVIIAIAFGVLAAASAVMPAPVDNLAKPE